MWISSENIICIIVIQCFTCISIFLMIAHSMLFVVLVIFIIIIIRPHCTVSRQMRPVVAQLVILVCVFSM